MDKICIYYVWYEELDTIYWTGYDLFTVQYISTIKYFESTHFLDSYTNLIINTRQNMQVNDGFTISVAHL